MKRREFIQLLMSTAANAPLMWPRFALGDDEPPPAQQPSDQPAAAPPDQPPSDQPSSDQAPAAQASDDSVGLVGTLAGTATVKRGDTAAVALKVSDPVFVNDTLRTGTDSSLGVTFDDQTTFSLSANTFIVVDKFLFEPDGKDNVASIYLGKGSAAFVASLVAKTGDMHITMESAVIGIRGTTGVIDVPDAGAGVNAEPTVKLYPDADGHVGQIEVSDFQGARLGTLTEGASAFAIRRAPGGRVTAERYQIPSDETVRDRGVLQRLTTSHDLGRQMTIQRQQLRVPNRQQPNNNQQPGGGRDQRGGQNNDRGRDNNQRGNENRGNENKPNENKSNENKTDQKKTEEKKANEKPNDNKAKDNKTNDRKAGETEKRGEKDSGNENKGRGRESNERGQNNERGGRNERGQERAGQERAGQALGRQNIGPHGPNPSGELGGMPHGGPGGPQLPGGLGLGRAPGGGGGRVPSGPNPFERKNH
jgi:hypothetical protein